MSSQFNPCPHSNSHPFLKSDHPCLLLATLPSVSCPLFTHRTLAHNSSISYSTTLLLLSPPLPPSTHPTPPPRSPSLSTSPSNQASPSILTLFTPANLSSP